MFQKNKTKILREEFQSQNQLSSDGDEQTGSATVSRMTFLDDFLSSLMDLTCNELDPK